MARRARPQEEIDALAASATLLLDDDHANYDGGSYRSAKATSPYQRGHIVYALIDVQPVLVLVDSLSIKLSHNYEYVNHLIGYVQRKDGKFSVVYRRNRSRPGNARLRCGPQPRASASRGSISIMKFTVCSASPSTRYAEASQGWQNPEGLDCTVDDCLAEPTILVLELDTDCGAVEYPFCDEHQPNVVGIARAMDKLESLLKKGSS